MNELSDKLDRSINHIDELLSKIVDIKLICIINNRVLLDNNYNLPSIKLSKDKLKENILLEDIYNYLNVNVFINPIPFELYNNYDLRYYKIEINNEDLVNLNNSFSFYDISKVTNQDDLDVLSKLINETK